ncbi:MAG: hypothetical protein KDF24_05815 [Rhodocyclaceae bacterium]|nr:hypothetical protein [Rhodocyclaceae bacterium]
MRLEIFRGAFGALLAALAGMAAAQTAELPTPDQFVVGERWEWRRVDSRTKVEISTPWRQVVTEAGEIKFQFDSGEVMPLSTLFLGFPTNKKPWRVWPLQVGAEWEFEADWTRPDGVSGNTRQDVEVVAYEEVSVPAGTFMAFRIEHKGWYRNSRGGSGKQHDTYWYAPEVKADVRRTRNDGYNYWDQELVSHTRPN